MTKNCRSCRRDKDESRFSPMGNGTDGVCRSCRTILRAASRYGGLPEYRDEMSRRIAGLHAKARPHTDRARRYAERKREIERLMERGT